MDKIAVIIFGATAINSGELEDTAIGRIPVISKPGGITGVKKIIPVSRNTQGVFTKKAAETFKINKPKTTVYKAREAGDVQPLFKDTGIIDKPSDSTIQESSRESTKGLSHLQDGRIKPTPYILKRPK